MLHRLCRPPSIPLSFGLATVLPRRSVSRVSWAPDPRRPRANTHRLRHGLPGYLILFAPHAFAPQRRIPPVFGDFHFQPDSPPTCPLRPVIPKNTCPPRLTAAAGTELAGASSSSPVMIAHSTKELYKRHCPSSLTRYCWIGLSPIVQDSPLLPPVGVRAVSQSQCG
ncbi:hypothetical protein LguiA_036051 [Lonicera macranthoides]